MSDAETRRLFRKLFEAEKVIDHLKTVIPLRLECFRRFGQERVKNELDASERFLTDSMDSLGIDREAFREAWEMDVESLVNGQESPQRTLDLVRGFYRELEVAIQAVPNSLDKARAALLALVESGRWEDSPAYDSMVLLREYLPPEMVMRVVGKWKADAKAHRERYAGEPFASNVFWVSYDFMEELDAVSRYRFREEFGITGDFPDAFEEVERMLAYATLDGLSRPELQMANYVGDQKFASVAYVLWLISRSRQLKYRLADFVRIGLARIASYQHDEGYWPDFKVFVPDPPEQHGPITTGRWMASTYLTALCTLVLLKLGESDDLKVKALRAVQWLLQHQNPDGSWSRESVNETGIVQEPDVFTSILALESLIRSGLTGIECSVNLGYNWILSRQNELGMWEDASFPFGFMTVLVLELARLVNSTRRSVIEMNCYLLMSRGMLDQSIRLARERNPDSRRLAIIAAHQGIESFLYGLLSQQSVNVKIFDDKDRDRTIGMRKALSELKAHLIRIGRLSEGGAVPYRNSLSRLAFIRDQVVHKGIEVTEAECSDLVRDAVSFTDRMCKELFGYDMWA